MTRRYPGPPITCACCGQTGEHWARGLLAPCYRRALRDGRLHTYPLRVGPAHMAKIRRSHQTRRAQTEGRIEDYVWLRDQGVSRDQAAARLGVTPRTVTRWHAQLRARGRRDPWLWVPTLPPHTRHLTQEGSAAA